MAELRPVPMATLVRRMFRELDQKQAIFDLPARKFFLGHEALDFSVRFHGLAAGSPLGPAAGPQSQMAQNIVLAWLGGSRILELKTVQIKDELKIPRPCIDMQTVGYNVEWSQELKLEQSLEEYVKGAMLVRMLRASGAVREARGFEPVLYDMSVGYDLAGIRSDRVQAFVRGMRNAGPVVDRLRAEIPDEWREFRDLDFDTDLSRTLTLSTFHGCPPDEIERIIDFLLQETGLHCIVKLNPTLLGPDVARGLLHDTLGYDELRIPDAAFACDTTWDQMTGFVERLGETARALGLGFGVKFSNTLIVENHRTFFPATETQMYLSGQPLHVLAMHLVARFRERFGDRFPISFSAGIDRTNFPDAVALGLVPVTVCTDLLRPGGYGRSQGYFEELAKRMREVGATTVDGFVLRAYGHEAAAGGDVSAAKLSNTRTYVERATADPRYRKAQNTKVPKKIGRRLRLFDCISCDKCVPVCPNDANFTFVLPPMDIPVAKVRREPGGWAVIAEEPIAVREEHQIATFADACNDCGNCDVFCPEDGGPYVAKPRFFGSVESFRKAAPLDGFFVRRTADGCIVHGRFGGREYRVELAARGGLARYEGEGFALEFLCYDPAGTLRGTAESEVDLTYFHLMDRLQRAMLVETGTNWVNSGGEER
jgi:putative selenate reductase